MGPEEVEKWIAVLRDFAIVIVATTLCLAQVVWVEPNTILIGGALALFGLPFALRLDRHRNKRRAEDHNGDPYDGPGGYWKP